jgi:hypothetical protein
VVSPGARADRGQSRGPISPQQAQPGNNNNSSPPGTRRTRAFFNLSHRARQSGQTSFSGDRKQARVPAPASTNVTTNRSPPLPIRERTRISTPLVQASGGPSTPRRPMNANPTTPAIEAKREKRPRFNTKERARKCISYTGIGRIYTWSEDTTGKALPRYNDCIDRNRKCKDIPFSTEILDRYLDTLADKSPTTDAAPISGPRFQFLQAIKRHTTAVNKTARKDNRSTASAT